ncbi:MAG: hypothetical protein LUH36_03705 [Oscillospiraceae bacterium]|nr:hypothetical protein [Oscillospiraceae bacterium]
MKNTVKNVLRELCLLILFALAVALVLALVALVITAVSDGVFTDSLWRLCAFAGSFCLLGTAVLLLTSRSGSKRMDAWEQRFPHIHFTYALLLIGVLLLLICGGLNYLN